MTAPAPSSSSDPINSITWQNNVLAKENETHQREFSTDAATIRFMNQSLSFYYFLNFYLFLIYVVLGLIAMYIVFFRTAWSAPVKFMGLLLVALYPFVISFVEYGLVYLVTYVYSLFVGKVHLDPYYENPPLSISSIFSFSSLV
jgi:hypothetical protein